jgi:hypothetical protein
MYTAPELPEEDVPVLSVIRPLTPVEAESGVAINILPLLPAALEPLRMLTFPPLLEEEAPALRTSSPPVPLLPLPTVT